MATVDEISAERRFAHGGLQRDAIGPQIFLPAFPPVRLFLDDIVELRLGNFTAPARRAQ